MGKAIFVNPDISFTGLKTDFLNNKVLPFITALPFDTIVYSTYRSIEKQTAMYNEYQKQLALYNAGKIKDKPSVVNRPGNSAHNYGLAIDIHPISMLYKDYDTMLSVSKTLGLVRDKSERWHFQDSSVSFEKMKLWYSEYKPQVNLTLIFFFFLLLLFIYLKFIKKLF
jgi:hypothetical protein